MRAEDRILKSGIDMAMRLKKTDTLLLVSPEEMKALKDQLKEAHQHLRAILNDSCVPLIRTNVLVEARAYLEKWEDGK